MKNNINKDGKKHKFIIKDKKKFISFSFIFFFVILLIIIFVFLRKDVVVDDNNISHISVNKYSKEIKLYYDNLMDDFLLEYNNVQNLIWTYIYNNVSGDKNIGELIDEVNNIFLSNNWSSIGLEKNAKWRGSYKIDKSTNVLVFKFESKDIEPKWIEDNNIGYIIEKN